MPKYCQDSGINLETACFLEAQTSMYYELIKAAIVAPSSPTIVMENLRCSTDRTVLLQKHWQDIYVCSPILFSKQYAKHFPRVHKYC